MLNGVSGLLELAATATAAGGLRVLLEFGQRHDVHLPAGAQFLGGLHIGLHLLQVPLELGAPILEPGDDLRVGEAQLLRDLVAIGGGQVLLVQEALFQLVDLVVGESRARLSPLLGGLPLPKDGHPVAACEERTV